jgi:hypothetical protein
LEIASPEVHKGFDRPAAAWCNEPMLGRLRRTRPLDVGLALAFAGAAYLVWALVAGYSRVIMLQVIRTHAVLEQTRAVTWPEFARAVKIFFVDTGFAIDLVGLAWLTMSLALLILASRQKISISWAWLSAIIQASTAALGAVLVGLTANASLIAYADASPQTALEHLSQISLAVVVAISILVWVVCLIWLLVDRARFDRHGPTLTDGLRTNR